MSITPPTVVACANCGKKNRLPAAVRGTPRCSNCHQPLPWIVEGSDSNFAEVAMIPMAELDTIGAGGGSLAFVDETGMFHVGPQSAGAVPGPACYQRGGTRPTVTDAMVVLGKLRPESFLGGAMAVDPALAEQALRKHVCRAAGDRSRRGGVEHRRGDHPLDDPGDRAQFGAAGLRPAGLHAGRPRRGRRTVRLRHRQRDGHSARAGAAAPGDHVRARAAGDRHASTSSRPPRWQPLAELDWGRVQSLLSRSTSAAREQLRRDGVAERRDRAAPLRRLPLRQPGLRADGPGAGLGVGPGGVGGGRGRGFPRRARAPVLAPLRRRGRSWSTSARWPSGGGRRCAGPSWSRATAARERRAASRAGGRVRGRAASREAPRDAVLRPRSPARG